MATHSSILAWRIPWTEEPGGYSPWGHKETDTTAYTHTHTHVRNTLFKETELTVLKEYNYFTLPLF